MAEDGSVVEKGKKLDADTLNAGAVFLSRLSAKIKIEARLFQVRLNLNLTQQSESFYWLIGRSPAVR